MMKKRVVITGIGPVTAAGTGRQAFFTCILNQECPICEIPSRYEEKYPFKSRHLVPAPEISPETFGIDPTLNLAMEQIGKLAVAGAKLALEDAGFTLEPGGKLFSIWDLADTGVILGVGMSSLQTAFNSYLSHVFGKDQEFLARHSGTARYNRMVIPMLMPNSASAWISILFGLKGFNYTVNAACASGTAAIGEAYHHIATGDSRMIITGGVECLREEFGATMRGFDMLGTLTRSSDGKPTPFSKGRSGFLFNEGAGCVLVLEEWEHARKRGATIYAEIADYAANSDAVNIVQMEETGAQIIRLLKKITHGRKIDYINAHGTGTVPNDQIEAEAIRAVFGDRETQPLINSTKGILGHSIGASGALEAAVTALSIYHGTIHGNHIPDPLENLNLVRQTTHCPIQYGLSTSYGFGGHNTALLLQRYDAEK